MNGKIISMEERRKRIEKFKAMEKEALEKAKLRKETICHLFDTDDENKVSKIGAFEAIVKMNNMILQHKAFINYMMEELHYSNPDHVVFDKVSEEDMAKLITKNILRHDPKEQMKIMGDIWEQRRNDKLSQVKEG
jgi:hypothetical protein